MHTVLYCCPSTFDCSACCAIPHQAIHAQQNKLISYCQHHNLPVDAIYTDVIAPKCMHNRPAFMRLIADARNHVYINLICPSLDTLCMKPDTQHTLTRFFERHGIQVIFPE